MLEDSNRDVGSTTGIVAVSNSACFVFLAPGAFFFGDFVLLCGAAFGLLVDMVKRAKERQRHTVLYRCLLAVAAFYCV
jgi:hypothetical protein